MRGGSELKLSTFQRPPEMVINRSCGFECHRRLRVCDNPAEYDAVGFENDTGEKPRPSGARSTSLRASFGRGTLKSGDVG
jgi:hypothetical protein